MQRMRPLAQLTTVLAFEGQALWLLRALSEATWIPSPTEILSSTPEEAIYGLAWVVALVLILWLALTTVASVLAHLIRIPAAIRAVSWITLPPIQRMANRVAAVSMAAASMATPVSTFAIETPPIPVVVVVDAPETPETTVTTEAVDVPLAPRIPGPAYVSAPDSAADVITSKHLTITPSTVKDSVSAAPVTYTVQPGDNMWTITANHLTEVLGQRPSNAQISEVWRVIMDLNRDSIRSGDVDLIFPGETLTLPTVRPQSKPHRKAGSHASNHRSPT